MAAGSITEISADKRLTQIDCDIANGQYGDPKEMTISGFLDYWVERYAEGSVSPRTLRKYSTIIRNHLKKNFGSMLLKDLEAHHVQEYYEQYIQSGLSARTVLNIHRLFRQILTQAVKCQLLPYNVLYSVIPPKVEGTSMCLLTADQARTLLRHAVGSDYHLPIHLALYTGLRRSEVLGMQWQDIGLERGTITVARATVGLIGDPTFTSVPKSDHSRRTIPVSPDTRDLLNAHYEMREVQFSVYDDPTIPPNMPVCARPNGDSIKPDALTYGYKRIATSCGFGHVRFLDLRHAYASLLLTEGVAIFIVQGLLGLDSIRSIVDNYGHIIPRSNVEAIANLDDVLNGPSFRTT